MDFIDFRLLGLLSLRGIYLKLYPSYLCFDLDGRTGLEIDVIEIKSFELPLLLNLLIMLVLLSILLLLTYSLFFYYGPKIWFDLSLWLEITC